MRLLNDPPSLSADLGTARAGLVDLMDRPSIELSPRRILAGDSLAAHLPARTPVYVPWLPNADLRRTLAACERIGRLGMQAVPHLAARAVAGHGQLKEFLGALEGLGVDSLLLVAGDRDSAAGPFRDSLDILESGELERHGIRRLGVAGHPDGHPTATAHRLANALGAKKTWARQAGVELWVVSQFVFSARVLIDWLERNRETIHPLKVRAGIPGPASLRAVIAYAAHCGVGTSARILRRNPAVARLLRHWTPDGMLVELAHYRRAHPDTALSGIHLFAFGGLADSARWLKRFAPARGQPILDAWEMESGP